MVTIDEGMQIDSNAEQQQKALLPRIESLQPGAKLTDETSQWCLKNLSETASISLPIVTSR
jgi:hypothetical protein